MSPFSQKIDELDARAQIHDVIMRHSRGIDRNDHHGARAEAFHTDAMIDSGHGLESVAELLAVRAKQHEHTEHTMHIVTNVIIDFCSDSIAVVESYVQAVEWERAGYDFQSRGISEHGVCGARIFSWCRYVDIFQARSGAWRIAERTTLFGDTTVVPLDVDPVIPPGFKRQTHSGDDPLYGILARAQEIADQCQINRLNQHD